MINLEWYRTFKAIYEQGTLTKASKILYTSQPGVSVHLNALEAYTGKTLFKRTSRQMIPTEDGKLLYDFILTPLLTLEKAEQHFKKTNQNKVPSINVGMCSEMFQLILEPEISKLKFNLQARFGQHPDLIKDLNNGILDLVITPKVLINKDSKINYIPFSKERMILIAGPKTDTNNLEHLIKENKITELVNELKQQTWYSASNEMEHFRRFWFENFNRKPVFKPNYILPNIASIIRCLSNNQGLAVVPDFLCINEVKNEAIRILWKGKIKTENILYFAVRNNNKHKEELEIIQNIFCKQMSKN